MVSALAESVKGFTDPPASPWKSQWPSSLACSSERSVLLASDRNDRSAAMRYCSSEICSLRYDSWVSESKLKRLRRSVVASRTFSPGRRVVL